MALLGEVVVDRETVLFDGDVSGLVVGRDGVGGVAGVFHREHVDVEVLGEEGGEFQGMEDVFPVAMEVDQD